MPIQRCEAAVDRWNEEPMHGPERKADRVGLNRYFSLSELAALAAIISGVNVVTAIARTFDTEQTSMLKACRSLEDGMLISRRPKIIETIKGQRAAWAHELTKDGSEIVEILKTDRTFMDFVEWVGKHPENPGKFGKMDK